MQLKNHFHYEEKRSWLTLFFINVFSTFKTVVYNITIMNVIVLFVEKRGMYMFCFLPTLLANAPFNSVYTANIFFHWMNTQSSPKHYPNLMAIWQLETIIAKCNLIPGLFRSKFLSNTTVQFYVQQYCSETTIYKWNISMILDQSINSINYRSCQSQHIKIIINC